MGITQPFFLRPLEVYMAEHPEEFEKKKSSSKAKTKKAPKVFDCSTCGLSEKCKHPKIKRAGKGKAGILIIDEQPGRSDDKYGMPLVGAPGIFLKRQLKNFFDIDLDDDCIRTTVVKCYPGRDKKGKDKKATPTQILCCRDKLLQDIAEVQPKLIICCGTKAIQAVANPKGLSAFAASNVHGLSFPVHEFNCWAGSLFRPSFFIRNRMDPGGKCDEAVFTNDLADILGSLDVPLPQPLTEEGNLLITDADQAVELLDHFATTEKPTSFDFETNTYNAFSPKTITYAISITDEVESAVCIPIEFQVNGKPIWTEQELDRIVAALKRYIAGSSPKIVQNYYMEEMWSRIVYGTPMNNFIHDTMVTAHVVNCNRNTTGQSFKRKHLRTLQIITILILVILSNPI